jgi:hypothetical protein
MNNNYPHDEVEEKERFDHKVFQMLRTEEYDPADSFKMGEAIQNASPANAEIIKIIFTKLFVKLALPIVKLNQ